MSVKRVFSGTDPELAHYASLFQQGEEKALSYFFELLHPPLSLFANGIVNNRQIAEEIASDAFLKIWSKHEKLNSFGTLRAYLYKTVYRDAVHALKKERKRNQLTNNSPLPHIMGNTALENMIKAESYYLIYSALKQLSPGSRKVISMHFLENKSMTEIATELNLSLNTVSTQKKRGLATLRKLMLPPILTLVFISTKIFIPSL